MTQLTHEQQERLRHAKLCRKCRIRPRQPLSFQCEPCRAATRRDSDKKARRRWRERLDRSEVLTRMQGRTDWHARFWAKVDKTPGYGPEGDCWIWNPGSKKQNQHGTFSFGPINVGAHVVSYGLSVGRLLFPFETKIIHSCDNPPCVNPGHLREGTNTDNSIDSQIRGRHAAGERHALAKLTFAQAREIRQLYRTSQVSQKELGRKYGVCSTTISDIVRGRRWNEPQPKR